MGPQEPPQLEADAIAVLEGSTFMVTDRRGDVREGSVAGLFHEDTRHLSKYELTLDGRQPELLTANVVDYYSAGFFLTNPTLSGAPGHTISVQRHRFVGEGLHDDVILKNHRDVLVRVTLRLSFGADFADLFEVKQKSFVKGGHLTRAHRQEEGRLRFDYEHDVFRVSTTVEFTQPVRLDGDEAVFDVELAPRGSWKTCVVVRLHLDEREKEPLYFCDSFGQSERRASRVLAKWRDEVPRVEAGLDVVRHVYRQSVNDLAALRLYAEVEGNEYSLPAAGLPWFMAIFGRDTLITSFQAIWVGPELARGALEALAALQGKDENDFRDEEPGKILHEIRFGELTQLGEKPHRPYYGTVDATPLWLILLSEYWRFTEDTATCRALRPNALRALEWIDRYGDRDGDGFVEYGTRSPQGLKNQGWKDSWDGVQFSDGRLAEPPIALAEVQGYVFDAKLRVADMAERVWGDPATAERLRSEAATLLDRFNEAFWVGGHYAVGLDRDKRPIDSATSNMGHLLWSGIVPPERAALVARRLVEPDLFSGWGVRTMSSEDRGYNPIGYHTGTVWPHDNSLICAGLVRYGFREEANRIAVAMFEAASFSGHRLPEVFAGYSRGESPFPVRYPTASSPQAWATAAPFLWLRLMLGLDVRDHEVVCDPAVPAEVGRLRLHGIHALGGHFDVEGNGRKGLVSVTG